MGCISLSDAFIYLLNQTSLIVDAEMIRTVYYLLNKKRLNEKAVDTILSDIYRYNDEIAHVQAANIIFSINSISLTRKLEFSLLLANFMLIKNNYYPVIFHESDKNYLKSLIKENNTRDLIELIYMHEYQTRNGIGSEDNSGVLATINELIDVIKKNETYLKVDMGVNHIFIYGSMAKRTLHKSSDIDLLVDLGTDLVNYQKHDTIGQIQRFLVSELNTKLDVLDFSYSLKHAEIKEMNNTIKIF